MKDVQVSKTTVIERMRANMETHTATYEAALERYRQRQIDLINEALDKAKRHRDVDRFFLNRLPVPENHTDDYRIALEMLELDERETVTLSQNDFKRYYLDEWEWHASFAANTTSYVVGDAE